MYNYSNVKDNLLVFKKITRNIMVIYELAGFEPSVTASLFRATSEMGHPPQPPEEQVLQELSGFFFVNKGNKTKMKAINTIMAATMVCNMGFFFTIQM
jgi:hypothetical protein